MSKHCQEEIRFLRDRSFRSNFEDKYSLSFFIFYQIIMFDEMSKLDKPSLLLSIELYCILPKHWDIQRMFSCNVLPYQMHLLTKL